MEPVSSPPSFALQPYGPRAWLARWPEDNALALSLPALCARLEEEPLPGLREWIPGFQTLALVFTRPVPAETVASGLALLVGTAPAATPGPPRRREIPVHYDGPDLEALAAAKGLDPATVIRLHSAPEYTVRMLGFSPGFPYLHPLDPRLRHPRLASPRPRVPAGSVGIGGSHTGIYSVAGPGGWNLLGRTPVPLFFPAAAQETHPDPARVFLLRPGDRVQFFPA